MRTTSFEESIYSPFRKVPRTGVIYVTAKAQQLGFGGPEHAQWVNLGQGMPECGELPGVSPRINSIIFDDRVQEYAPVAGLYDLRAAVADMYNRRFRRGRSSLYTAENVAISAGGRLALTRLAAALGSVHLGHFLPDYTAYEELLDVFRLFTPIPIALDEQKGFSLSVEELRREIMGRGLSAVLLSNPSNPAGNLVAGQELNDWIRLSSLLGSTLIFDEFYSHYIWDQHGPMMSAAEFVDDVEKDQVVILDGLTKNWRYSGWRMAWTVGPRSVIEAITSAGSFLDGGSSHPLQKAAIPLLEDSVIDQENAAIQKVFGEKRKIALKRCQDMGLVIHNPPKGTFYLFADLSKLPEPISTGMGFFQAALKEKVITVPGEFFDVNPGKKRRTSASRFHRHLRLSFGPSQDSVETGLDRLAAMITSIDTVHSQA